MPRQARPSARDGDESSPRAITRRAKLIVPALPPDRVARAGIDAALTATEGIPLTVLCAPVGFGKTLAAATWMHHTRMPVAWLNLDEQDADPARLFTHLVMALRSVHPGFAPELDAMIALSHEQSGVALGEALSEALIDLPERTGIVLDDAHVLQGGDALALIAELLRFPLPLLHLVVTTRSLSGFDLGTMQSRGQVSVFDARSLRFTAQEVASFLSLHAIAPDAKTDVLEGWPAGLRLAAMVSLGAAGEDVTAPVLGARLLIAEFIGAMTRDDREIMMAAALPPQFSAALLADMLGIPERHEAVAASILRLAHGNAFLTPLDDEGVWWRMHAVLRDALRTGAASVHGNAGLAALRHRAGMWLVAHGDVDDAARMFLEAGDRSAAVTAVEEQVIPAIMAMRGHEMGQWLSQLPKEQEDERVMLQIGRVDRLIAAGATAEAEITLDRIDRMIAQRVGLPRGLDPDVLFGIALVYRSVNTLLGRSDPMEGLRLAEEAETHFRRGERYAINSRVMSTWVLKVGLGDTEGAIAYLEDAMRQDTSSLDLPVANYPYFLTMCHLLNGDYPSAIAQAEHLQRLARDAGFAVRAIDASVCLGTALYVLDRLDEAESAYRDAQQAEHFEAAHILSVQESTFGMALIMQATGREVEAIAVMDRYLQTMRRTGKRALVDLARSFRLRLLVLQGKSDRAIAELGTIGTSLRQPVSVIEHPPLTRALVLAQWGTPEARSEAIALCTTLLAPQGAALGAAVRQEARVILALALLAGGDRDAAGDVLEQALAINAGGGTVRPFVVGGETLAPLYRALAERGNVEAARIAHWFDTAPLRTSEPLLALSRREREVLDMIRMGMTNKEIGDALFISPFTVKRHAQTIFRKLGVSSRDEASAAAARMNQASH